MVSKLLTDKVMNLLIHIKCLAGRSGVCLMNQHGRHLKST